MSTHLIQDYLQTQGLRLSIEEVRVAQIAAQTVMNVGHAEIDNDILWCTRSDTPLLSHLDINQHKNALKGIFLALDACYERQKNIQSLHQAVVYLFKNNQLIRMASQGEGVVSRIELGENAPHKHLAARTAQSAWLHIVSNTSMWQNEIDMPPNMSQMSLPICNETGGVLGVLYVESTKIEAFIDPEAQSAWVGLAFALIEPLHNLSSQDHTTE